MLSVRKMKLPELLLMIMLAYAANDLLPAQQPQTGSYVVWMANDTDLVLAAESRERCDGEGCRSAQVDNACKIAALPGKNLIFSLAGLRGDGGPDIKWDAFQIAAQLASERNTDTAKGMDELAKAWAERVVPLAEQTCAVAPPILDKEHPLTYTTGFFASPLRNGKLHTVEVYFPISPRSSPCAGAPKIVQLDTNIADSRHMNEYGTGIDYVQKYLESPINRRRERQSGLNAHTYPDITDMSRMTFRMVQIAVEVSGTRGDVGGPIDQIHLSSKGVEWLHRKPNCPLRWQQH